MTSETPEQLVDRLRKRFTGLPDEDLPVSYHYPECLDSLRKLEAMKFEILLPGHDE